jgi:hypothetical protein
VGAVYWQADRQRRASGAGDASGVTARSSDESTTLSVGVPRRVGAGVVRVPLGLPVEDVERAVRDNASVFVVTVSYMHPVFRFLCR